MLGNRQGSHTERIPPEKTIVFCAMAAEEWGDGGFEIRLVNRCVAAGFRRPSGMEGKVAADFNFELPAHAREKKDAIRTV